MASLDFLKTTAVGYDQSSSKIKKFVEEVEDLENKIPDFDSEKVIEHLNNEGGKDPLQAYRELTDKPDKWQPEKITKTNLEEKLGQVLFKGEEPEDKGLTKSAFQPKIKTRS